MTTGNNNGGGASAPSLAALSAQPAVSVPDGWKLVPVRHTAAMHRAGSDALDTWDDLEKGAPGKLMDVRASMCWSAMLAAVPHPAPQPVAVNIPEELCGVPDVLEEGRGMWRTCTGCHEVFEGHPVGEYPYSKVMKCDLGSGCFECGGIGAIWDTTDYEEMGRHLAQDCDTPPADEWTAVVSRLTQERDEARDEVERLNGELDRVLVKFADEQARATAAEARVKALEEDMSEIARQKLPVEMTAEQKNYADFEGGYAACVDKARAALKGGEA